ncbi:MAG: cyclic nucleotide-binding domain-containing protein [Candidatus Brocadiales bacterium]|nr:cyclic nucleotide-binding domain-containing protein [Candidatus Brocadiales bacterium]
MGEEGLLGKVYNDGEIIVQEGSAGREMYVIQSGKVQVSKSMGSTVIVLATLGEGEVFGEMSLIDSQPRSATVRALGETRVLTIDHEAFLRRVRSDPFLALSILRQMGLRIRELDHSLSITLGKLEEVQRGLPQISKSPEQAQRDLRSKISQVQQDLNRLKEKLGSV